MINCATNRITKGNLYFSVFYSWFIYIQISLFGHLGCSWTQGRFFWNIWTYLSSILVYKTQTKYYREFLIWFERRCEQWCCDRQRMRKRTWSLELWMFERNLFGRDQIKLSLFDIVDISCKLSKLLEFEVCTNRTFIIFLLQLCLYYSLPIPFYSF